MIITIADSNRRVLKGDDDQIISNIIPESRIPEYFHELVNKVMKFKNYTIVVRYIDCPQQQDGHSCGMFTALNAIALAKYGTTDVLNKESINVSFIKRRFSNLIDSCLKKEVPNFGNKYSYRLV